MHPHAVFQDLVEPRHGGLWIPLEVFGAGQGLGRGGAEPAAAREQGRPRGEARDALEDRRRGLLPAAQGVVQGQQVLHRLGLQAGRPAPGQQAAGLGGEQDPPLVVSEVERLDPEPVAHQPGAAVAAHEAEGVHAAQPIERRLALLGVDVEQGLEVRACGEPALQLELVDQLQVVVDFPVADHGRARRVQRLPAMLQVDDGQARVGQGGVGQGLHPGPVGAAVGEGLDQGPGLRLVRFADDARDPAHGAPQPSPNWAKTSRHLATMARFANSVATRSSPAAVSRAARARS